jgi:glycosyltransferase involved in cell wall biosynthesis
MIISVGLLLANLGVLALVLYNARKWPAVFPNPERFDPCVSVLMPVRNEERHICEALRTIVRQPGILEILVYNDHSTDRTADLVSEVAREHPAVRTVPTAPLPAGWYGKPFACYQLAAHARGRWLLFLDADARLTDNAVPAMVEAAEDYRATLISFWPRLEMTTVGEKIFMPLLNFVVFSLFPAPLSFTMDLPSLGLAHGACILADRAAYQRVGGHAQVGTELFEDTALARVWRRFGERSLCVDGQHVVRVRMYETLAALWRGFEKIVFPAFRRVSSFILFYIFHFMVFVWPFLVAVMDAVHHRFNALMWGAVGAAMMSRAVQALRFGYPVASVVLHPIAEAALTVLALSSAIKCSTGLGVSWKGRRYFARETAP